MTLKETIDKDFIDAYKAHEDREVSVLRMVKSAVKNAEISAKADLSDAEIVKILRREVKQREESIESFKAGNRTDLIEETKLEIEIIGKYLPAQMSEADIEKIVAEVIADAKPTGMSEMGKIIGLVMQKANGNADGGLVAGLVKKHLL